MKFFISTLWLAIKPSLPPLGLTSTLWLAKPSLRL